MARMARAVAVGIPHHVTERGNRRQQTFFCEGDYQTYISLMAEWCSRYGVEIWAYCLMPNRAFNRSPISRGWFEASPWGSPSAIHPSGQFL